MKLIKYALYSFHELSMWLNNSFCYGLIGQPQALLPDEGDCLYDEEGEQEDLPVQEEEREAAEEEEEE